MHIQSAFMPSFKASSADKHKKKIPVARKAFKPAVAAREEPAVEARGSFEITIEKPLKAHNTLSVAARARIIKFGKELRTMEQEWIKILNGEFVFKVMPKDSIHCVQYDHVLRNWPKIRAYLDTLRATRNDLPWPECLPSGITHCTDCTEYVQAWIEAEGR